MLSITKVEIPRARQGRIMPGSSFRLDRVSRSMVLRPLKNRRTHRALTAWLMTVAMAAPSTPM